MLRGARLAAGFASQAKVVKKTGSSQPTLSRIESGLRIPDEAELGELLALYKLEGNEEIEALAVRAREATGGLDPDFILVRKREKKADRVRKFCSERIPTALQSGPYILAQHELADVPYNLNDVVNDYVTLAEDLKREEGPVVEVIVSVSAFLRMPGGSATIAKEQAIHLLTLLDAAPRLSLRVLMFDANVAFIDTDFIIVNGGGPDLIYAQSGRDGFLIKDKNKIQERERYWDLVSASALSIDETRAILRKLAERDLEALVEMFSIAN